MDGQIVWQSQCLNTETVRDGAEWFIREYFNTERHIIWGDSPGEFHFSDSYYKYTMSCEGGHWYVRKTEKLTPKAKKRVKARQEIKPAAKERGHWEELA